MVLGTRMTLQDKQLKPASKLARHFPIALTMFWWIVALPCSQELWYRKARNFSCVEIFGLKRLLGPLGLAQTILRLEVRMLSIPAL